MRKLSKGIDVQSALAAEEIAACGIQPEVLRLEWAEQRKSQCSIRPRMSAHFCYYISNC